MLRDFALRLNGAADRAHITQSDVAGKMGVSPSRVGNWFQGRHLPMKRERADLARILGVSVEWLLTGTESVTDTAESLGLAEVALAVREVPVISWSHAGQATTYEEIPKDGRAKVATQSSDKRAFAVIVEGDCMEPKFLEGDFAVLEPLAMPRNGKPVVAKLKDDAVQLRVYTKMPNGKIRLASLKPEIYPTIDYSLSDFHWIYPVRQVLRDV